MDEKSNSLNHQIAPSYLTFFNDTMVNIHALGSYVKYFVFHWIHRWKFWLPVNLKYDKFQLKLCIIFGRRNFLDVRYTYPRSIVLVKMKRPMRSRKIIINLKISIRPYISRTFCLCQPFIGCMSALYISRMSSTHFFIKNNSNCYTIGWSKQCTYTSNSAIRPRNALKSGQV